MRDHSCKIYYAPMRNIPRAARPARLAQHTRECETERMSEKHERTEATNTRILTMLSNELDLKPTRVRAAVNLLDSGSSVPFIARYRKEATGALTDTHLRAISTRLDALRALETRRENILSSLAQRREDGLIDPLTYEQLITGVGAASSKQDLEALYAPYRSERITKAQRARAQVWRRSLKTCSKFPLPGSTILPQPMWTNRMKPTINRRQMPENPKTPELQRWKKPSTAPALS